jgi:hypothetical protein
MILYYIPLYYFVIIDIRSVFIILTLYYVHLCYIFIIDTLETHLLYEHYVILYYIFIAEYHIGRLVIILII